MAQLGIIIIFTQFYRVCIHFLPTSLYPRRKTIWSEQELNPGPLASQATTLTTRPRALLVQSEEDNFIREQD